MCAGACVWSRIGAVVYGVSQEDIAAYGSKLSTDVYKWRASLDLLPLRLREGQSHHPRNRRLPPPGNAKNSSATKLHLDAAFAREFQFRTQRQMNVKGTAFEGTGTPPPRSYLDLDRCSHWNCHRAVLHR
jgi:hypothetical protein